MRKSDTLAVSFVIGISFLGASCLLLATCILIGAIPFEKAVQTLGSVTAASIGLLGAVYAAYLAHQYKTQHERQSIAKALAGEVMAIRTCLYNGVNDPPDWSKVAHDRNIWSCAVQSLRPPSLTVIGPEVLVALGGLDHNAVFKYVEFRGHFEVLLRQIDLHASLNPDQGVKGIASLLKLMETVGRQADGVATAIAKDSDINLSFGAKWVSSS